MNTVEKKFEEEFTKIVESDEAPSGQEDSILVAFAQRLNTLFEEFKKLRRPKETEWLENLRQHKGIYDPEVLALIPKNSSKVYPKITRARDNSVLSRLHEMLFPDNDRAWEIEPTPVPKVPQAIAKEIARRLVTVDPETGTPILPTRQQLEQAINEYAKGTCKEMQTEMDDQLTEMEYSPKIGKPTLRSGIILGTGLVKGPLPQKYFVNTYEATEDDVVRKEQEKLAPDFRYVQIWNFYPDMNVTEFEDMEGCFERHVMSKHQVRKLAKRKGFNKAIIEAYLRENKDGNYKKQQWEMDLEGLDQSLIAKNAFASPEGTATQKVINRKYEVLEYWGYVDGYELSASGVTLSEDQMEEEIPAVVWVLGDKIIKAVVNELPVRDIPYHPFYYEKDETSIFGEGLPRQTRHSQITVCAAARMMLNNAAICSGPQFEVNSTVMINEDIDAIYPMKVWVREGRGVEGQYPGLRVYHVESHIEEYIKIIDTFIKFGDIESTMPTWMLSEPQAMQNQTAQTSSMQMGSLTVTLKDVVRNFDIHMEGIIKDLYAWNMEFNEKPEIKGDYKVKMRGSASLVTKEVRMQALNMFAQTMQPEDYAYVSRREFLDARVKAHDLPITLKSEEEADAYRQAMVDREAVQLQKEDMKAEIRKKHAMALNLTTKAKGSNIEANQKAMGIGEGGEQVDSVERQLKHAGMSIDNQNKIRKMQREDQTGSIKMAKEVADLQMKKEKHDTDIELQKQKHDTDMELSKKKGEAAMKQSAQKAKEKSKEKKSSNKAK